MLDALFRPRSVAVIGASTRRLTIGYQIIQNLLEFGFTGTIYPVNPKAPAIRSIHAHPSILDVPDEVDLAHIIVKNTMVPDIIAECGTKGVKVAIVNTSGFSEVGGEGIALEQEIVRVARANRVRLFGPNCQGIINTDPEIRAYCNFTFTRPTEGSISVIAQSGGVAEVINNRLYELGAGLRMYASNGNACDVSIPEIIAYWGDDPGTRVIVCHVESLSDPAEFLRVASMVARRKPVLGLKTGRTRAGARAVSSHTGGLMKEDTTTEIIFREAGVVSFSDQASMCEAAYALASQPAPAGRRVGVMTNAGGPGIISTDEIIGAGCEIPELGEATQAALRAVLFDEAIVTNPVDVLATGTPEQFGATVRMLLEDDGLDAVLVNFITPFFVDCKGVAREIVAAAPGAAKPVVVVVMTRKESWTRTLRILREGGVPVFDLPEQGARALGAMVRDRTLRDRPHDRPAEPSISGGTAAAAIIDRTLARGRTYLPQVRAYELLEAYGLRTPKAAEAGDLEECLEAATAIGYPVVLKVERDDVVHKSDSGGIVLGLGDEDALSRAWTEMRTRFQQPDTRFLVAASIDHDGPEVMMGAKREAGLGHVVAFGLGGVFVEVLGDVAFGIAPLSESQARDLITGVKGFPLLSGARGRAAVDISRLADALCRLGRLVTDNPRITELDLNPVFAFPAGRDPIVVDARIRVSGD
ncbi:MAG: acetate--CoA ligase family protein [Acidobacteria bacterium]|nr:acetate--CoA ligase family protein [Acidobacteriota bacterium]